VHVTGKQLSTILGISDRRIRQLVSENVLERDANNNKFYLPGCVQRYIEYKTASSIGNLNVDYSQEKARHERAKRIKAEVELSHLVGKMHEAADVESVMTDMIIKAKTKLRGIPAKIAASLLTQTELSAVESMLESEIDECLTELKTYSPGLFNDSQKEGDSDE